MSSAGPYGVSRAFVPIRGSNPACLFRRMWHGHRSAEETGDPLFGLEPAGPGRGAFLGRPDHGPWLRGPAARGGWGSVPSAARADVSGGSGHRSGRPAVRVRLGRLAAVANRHGDGAAGVVGHDSGAAERTQRRSETDPRREHLPRVRDRQGQIAAPGARLRHRAELHRAAGPGLRVAEGPRTGSVPPVAAARRCPHPGHERVTGRTRRRRPGWLGRGLFHGHRKASVGGAERAGQGGVHRQRGYRLPLERRRRHSV